MKKRGAMELSMNTIIVIVIGITLLSLGLVFIRAICKNIRNLAEGAFEQADAEIGRLQAVDRLLTISPNNIKLQQGKSKAVDVIIANFENVAISASVSAKSENPDIECKFADTFSETSKTYTIDSGKQANIKLIATEKGGELGIKVCNVEVHGDVSGDTTDSMLVTVEKKRGFFE